MAMKFEMRPALPTRRSERIANRLVSKSAPQTKRSSAVDDVKPFPVGDAPTPRKINQFSAESLFLEYPNRHKNGLENIGLTCYMNASMQLLYGLPSFMGRAQSESKTLAANGKVPGVTGSFLRLYDDVSRMDEAIVRPRELKEAIDASTTCFTGVHQHDAQEFLMHVLNKLEEEHEQGASTNISPVDMFNSQINSSLRCSNCAVSRDCIEKHSHLSLGFEGIELKKKGPMREFPLEKMFDKYFEPETIEYRCEECDGTDFSKQQQILEMPEILLVQIKRFKQQQKTRRLTKVRARVNLPMELDLAKFSSFKNEYPEERSSSDQSEDDTAEQCATKRKCTETDEPSTPKRAKVELPNTKYELSGVIHHNGKSINSGHYFTVVNEGSDNWALYDDHKVYEMTSKKALGGVQKNNCYIAAYSLRQNC